MYGPSVTIGSPLLRPGPVTPDDRPISAWLRANYCLVPSRNSSRPEFIVITSARGE
jgi:hypothetical protein